jgi:hypothetical protein
MLLNAQEIAKLKLFGLTMNQKHLDDYGIPICNENEIQLAKEVQALLKKHLQTELPNLEFNRKANFQRFFSFSSKHTTPQSASIDFSQEETNIEIIFTPFYWDTENRGDIDFEKLTISKEHISENDRNSIYVLLKTRLPTRLHLQYDYTHFHTKSEIKRILNAYADFNLGKAHVLNFNTRSYLTILGCKTSYTKFAEDPQTGMNNLIQTYQEMQKKYEEFTRTFR